MLDWMCNDMHRNLKWSQNNADMLSVRSGLLTKHYVEFPQMISFIG